MPEGLEAEIWSDAIGAVTGRTIATVWVDQRVADPRLIDVLPGCVVTQVRRIGKVVLLDTDGSTVGLHFGMTGRVVVDGVAPIDRLEYASGNDHPEWDRLRLFTNPVDSEPVSNIPAIRMNDPRRLGRISLDPEMSALGVDIFKVTAASLGSALAGRTVAIKPALLNQKIVAGLGNLCADEVLWWASVAPHRRVDTLAEREVKALASAVRRRLPIMLRRGGSTTGTLTPALRVGETPCPRDGEILRRSKIGGRTAVWCPAHQT